MLRVINRAVKAPITYIADLRSISFKQYLLISTNYSPSYPIMIFSSLAFTLLYCSILIYYVFNSSFAQRCYKDVKNAAYLITILYPIQTVLCFICLTGSIALSKNNCWKVVMIMLFGPIMSGFGFGEVGFVQLCILAGQDEKISIPDFLLSPTFVSTMVYTYICFLTLYFILVPCITYLFKRQQESKVPKLDKNNKKEANQGQEEKNEQKKEDPQKRSCCDRFVCFFYYFTNILFTLAVIFVIFIKIIGPVIFTVIWIVMASHIDQIQSSMEKLMFAALILSYFAPLGIMFIVLGFQRLVKLGKGKKDGNNEIEASSRRSTWQPDDPKIQNSQLQPNMRLSKNEKRLSKNLKKPQKQLVIQESSEKKQQLL